MTKEQLKQQYTVTCIAILSTMADQGSVPLGICYAALMNRVDLETFNGLIGCLVRAGLATKQGNLLSITETGRKMVAAVNKAIADQESAS